MSATEYVPDYLRSATKDGKKPTFIDSGHYMLSNGEFSKCRVHSY